MTHYNELLLYFYYVRNLLDIDNGNNFEMYIRKGVICAIIDDYK